jgi:hypothetical protein
MEVSSYTKFAYDAIIGDVSVPDLLLVIVVYTCVIHGNTLEIGIFISIPSRRRGDV